MAQEAEVRKAEREREKRDALDKANSSAHSDGSLKSGSIRAHRSKRSAKVLLIYIKTQFNIIS